MNTEIWKDIKGFEGKYQISNFGRVKSLARLVGNGKGYMQKERIRKHTYNNDGYPHISLVKENRKTVTTVIHKLVTTHLISEHLPEGYHICHKDGDILNNHVDNLYIGNVFTNTLDKFNQSKTKLTLEDIKVIRKLKGKVSQGELAEMFNVRSSYISRIHSGKRLGWLTNN